MAIPGEPEWTKLGNSQSESPFTRLFHTQVLTLDPKSAQAADPQYGKALNFKILPTRSICIIKVLADCFLSCLSVYLSLCLS